MAKSYVVNKLGDRTFPFYIPSTAQNAADFLALLDGEWEIYEQIGTQGNEVVTGEYKHATVMLQDDSTKKKTYLRFYVPASKTEDDIVAALQGKTLNGVHADAVYVLNLSWVGTPSIWRRRFIMTLETGTALSALAYVVLVSGFIFRMEGRVRSMTERLEKMEMYYTKYMDDLAPTIHKLDGKIDTLFHLFSKKQIDFK